MMQWINKHKVAIWAVAVFGVSVTARFINLNGRMWWDGDVGRDILVGYHIARYHEFPIVGATASYFASAAYYIPYYYYILGFIGWIFPDAESMIRVVVLLESLVPVFLFFIALPMGSFVSAAAVSLILAVSAYMTVLGNVFSIYVAAPFFFCGLALFMASGKRNLSAKISGQAIMFFAAFIHYSYVPPAAIFFLWAAWKFVGRQQKGVFIFVCLIILSVLSVPLFFQYQGAGGLTAVNVTRVFKLRPDIVSDYIRTLGNIWSDMFVWDRVIEMNAAIITVLLLSVSFRSILGNLRKHPWLMAVVLGIPLMGSLFAIRPGLYSYSVVIILYVLMVVGPSVSDVRMTIGNAVRLVLISLLIVFYTRSFMNISYSDYQFDKARTIAAAIMADVRARNIQDSFGIFATPIGSMDYYWGRPNYWYFIEKDHNYKIAKIINSDENLESTRADSDHLYLICRGGVRTREECRKRFEDSVPDHAQTGVLQTGVQDASVWSYNRTQQGN